MQRRGLARLVLGLVLVAALVAGIAVGRSRRTVSVADESGAVADAPTSEAPTTIGGAPVEGATTTVPQATTTAVAAPVPQATTSPAPSTASTAEPVRYAFPVKPATGATYGRTHHDYPAADVFAPCGAAVLAPTSGTLTELRATDAWSAGNDTGATRGGLSFTLVGDDGVRYYGSHLQSISGSVAAGARVEAGREIGVVGRSGNALGTPPPALRDLPALPRQGVERAPGDDLPPAVPRLVAAGRIGQPVGRHPAVGGRQPVGLRGGRRPAGRGAELRNRVPTTVTGECGAPPANGNSRPPGELCR